MASHTVKKPKPRAKPAARDASVLVSVDITILQVERGNFENGERSVFVLIQNKELRTRHLDMNIDLETRTHLDIIVVIGRCF